MEGNIARILGGPWSPKEPDRPEVQLRVAMAQLDLDPPTIVLDGQLHRFAVGNSKDAGWYVAYGDGVPAGMFGNWKTGEAITFRADVGRKLTAAEEMAHARRVAELKKKRDEDTQVKHENAAEVASKIWANAGIADDKHPYLQRKGVKAHTLRITGDGRLIAPMYDADGNISSLQYISSDGAKSFHPGGAVRGCYAILGEPAQDIYIAEGYATGATIYETIHKAVVIAYSAGNIPAVTETIRAKFPVASLTIVADNDASGVGQNYAEQAAAKYGARVVVSPVASDVNDFVQGGGDLLNLLNEQRSRFTEKIITSKSLRQEFVKTLTMSWVIKDIIPESSGLSMIYGAPGTYKSFVAIDMALSIANGIEWHGKRVKQQPVLYVAAEGQYGVLKRFEVWRKYHGIEELQNVAILPMAVKLDNSIDVADLIQAIREMETPPGFIFFDTLARSMDGEENSKVDMAIVINAADVLRHEFGTQIVVIHHSGKDATKGARGSNSLEGATDTTFRIEKGKDEYTAVMTCDRQKDNEPAEPIGFVMKKINTDETNIDGDEINSLVPVVDYDVVPSKSQKSTTSDDIDGFEKAWISGGKELFEGAPFVQKVVWKTWLVDNKKSKSENAARTAIKPSGGGTATRLLDANLIREIGTGFVLSDPAYCFKFTH